MWKIDVVEQGSGFTDSKVFAIEESETPPIITLPPITTTTLAPATTLPSSTTTTSAPSTTQATTTTTLAPVVYRGVDHHDHGSNDNVARVDNVAVYHYCDDDPCDATGYRAGVGYPALSTSCPGSFRRSRPGSASSIPTTGGTGVIPAGAVAVIMVGLGGLVIVATRRRDQTDAC